MPRIILTQCREQKEGIKTFECTREDFFIWLFILDITHIRVETDGHIIYVIYIRSEVDEAIKRLLDPSIPLMSDYRKVIVARETWRTFLQLLSDYKNNKQ